MKNSRSSHQIRVVSSIRWELHPHTPIALPFERVMWTVFIGDVGRAMFTGAHGRERAVEAALQLAEELRSSGAVSLVIEPTLKLAS